MQKCNNLSPRITIKTHSVTLHIEWTTSMLVSHLCFRPGFFVFFVIPSFFHICSDYKITRKFRFVF
jgi:hypothetical protein